MLDLYAKRTRSLPPAFIHSAKWIDQYLADLDAADKAEGEQVVDRTAIWRKSAFESSSLL